MTNWKQSGIIVNVGNFYPTFVESPPRYVIPRTYLEKFGHIDPETGNWEPPEIPEAH